MESQLCDRFLQDSWSTKPFDSNLTNSTSDLWLNQYNPPAYNFEDLQCLDDLKSSLNLSTSSSPTEFSLPSPISDSSFLSIEDMFDQKSLIDPWVSSIAFNDNITINPATLDGAPSGEKSTEEIFNLVSSPESSGPASPQDIKHDMGAKKSAKQDRKHRLENCGTKSHGSKIRNAHNLIEKKYRNNLNRKINTLRDSIPSLCSAMKGSEESQDSVDNDTGEIITQKYNKGTVLDKAIEHIANLQNQVNQLSNENARLQILVGSSLDSYLC